MHVIITGANRGIGLALTRGYANLGHTVIALCRQASPALLATSANIISTIDLQDPATYQRLPELVKNELNGHPIDLLINNAGILFDESIDTLNEQQMMAQFQVNSLAPLLVSQCLLPAMKHGSKIAMITSRMGSMADNGSGGYYGYRMSKAALNAASVSLAYDLADAGIIVAILHPGFVQTDMVGGAGHITPDESAQALIQQIDDYQLANTGQFRHSNGETLPW